jgi:hypothetical protein
MKRLPPLLLAALLLIAAPAAAQSRLGAISTDRPGLGTDRPGLGTETSVVAPGSVQIEVGTPSVARGTFDGIRRAPDDGVIEAEIEQRAIRFPTLLRVGLIDRLELRVSSGVYTFERERIVPKGDDFGPSTTEEDGVSGFTVGLKGQLLQPPGYTLALAPRVTLPGGGEFTDDRASFAADAALSAPLFEQVGGTLVVGGALSPVEKPSGSIAVEEEYALSGNVVGVLERAPAEQIGGYVEGAFRPSEGSNAAFLGAGLTYQVVPTAQLDVFFDRGLTNASTDWLFGGGVSIRPRRLKSGWR